jgi:hypothetical protein
MYDLAVAYRIYPKVSKPAHGLPFDDDKLRQAEICVRSFKESLASLKVRIWAILDSCPPEYEAMFRRYFSAEDLVVVNENSIGNAGTFRKQIDLLLKQQDAEMVYFAEDDYLYLGRDLSILIDFMRGNKDVDFVSAFDHPDDYFLDFQHFPKWVRAYDGRHWRNAASTCLTFLTTKARLAEYEGVFRSYERRNYDTGVWMSITKYRLFNVRLLIRYMMQGSFLWRMLLKCWYYNTWQNLFGRRASLWIPMPSFALHLDRHHVAPGFDLPELLRREDDLMQAPVAGGARYSQGPNEISNLKTV